MSSARIRHDGADVLMMIDGREYRMPHDAALAIARQLYAHGKLAEEIAKREQIVIDQAIILRAGAPFGLTSHPYLQAEAAKEAAWNSDLRRAMPGGIKSSEQFGVPAIVAHPLRRKP